MAINRVVNGAIVQDEQSTDANRVLNGFIFQEEASAAAGTTVNVPLETVGVTTFSPDALRGLITNIPTA